MTEGEISYSEIRALASAMSIKYGISWDELTQEGWIRAMRYPHMKPSIMVGHAAIRMIQNQVMHSPRGVSLDDRDDRGELDSGLKLSEDVEYVRWALADIADLDRAIFVCRYMEDMNHREIENITGVNHANQQNSIRRTKVSVRRKLEQSRTR